MAKNESSFSMSAREKRYLLDLARSNIRSTFFRERPAEWTNRVSLKDAGSAAAFS
jgi:hypothetical protein